MYIYNIMPIVLFLIFLFILHTLCKKIISYSIVSIVVILLLFIISPAFASYNSFQYFIGDRASGMGGAYTALANDPAALWYNPAGLALMNNSKMNISASSYNILQTSQKGAVKVETQTNGTEEIDVKQKDFSIVPTSLGYGYDISSLFGRKAGFALGLFIPSADSLQSSIDESIRINNETMDIYSLYKQQNKLYIFSLGSGINLFKYLNVGISAGLGYFSQIRSEEWRQYYKNSLLNIENFYNRYMNQETTSLTATGSIGMQSKIGNNHLAVFYRFAHIKLYNDSKLEIFTDSFSSNGSVMVHNRTIIETDNYKNIPAQLTVGYAYENPGSFAVSFEATRYFKQEDLEKNIINGNIGLEIYLSNTFIMRTGFFTDLSQKKELTVDSREQSRRDYYGATLSFSNMNEINKKQFWTTIGIGYRLGIGEYKVTSFGPSGVNQTTRDWTTHGFHIYFSESIYF